MPAVDWYIEGIEFGGCNCAYACRCQFEDVPTHGHCRGFESLDIERGYFDDVDLGGLRCAILYAWPGPIYEGKGELQVIIDERADERQRAALATVLHGGETDEAATHWWVFHEMSSTVHPTLYAPIEFEADIDARTATVTVPGVLNSTGRPIRNPIDGAEHRVRIDIPPVSSSSSPRSAVPRSPPTARSSLISKTPTASSIVCGIPAPASCADAERGRHGGGQGNNADSGRRPTRRFLTDRSNRAARQGAQATVQAVLRMPDRYPG